MMLHPEEGMARLMATLFALSLLCAAMAWKAFDEPRVAAAILVGGAAAMFAGAIWRALR
ncbi:MAG: hypothetical protein ABL871_08475 [Terricaulis sp.]